MELGEEKKIEQADETAYSTDLEEMVVYDLEFHKFYHKNPGKLFDDKAEAMLVKDLQKIYDSKLESLANENKVKIPHKKNIKSYTPLLRTFKFYEDNPDSAITIFPEGQPSPVFTAGMTALYEDVNAVMKWAEDDFVLYAQNLGYNPKEVKITPWKRIVAGIVIGTAVLTTAVSGFVFSYIFDKKVESLEKSFDDKIKVFDKNLESLEKKFDDKIKGAAGIILDEFETKYENFWKKYDSDEKFREEINKKIWDRLNELAGDYQDKK